MGLDVSKPGKQNVKFTITRDAGKFDCEGYLENGEGAGFFHFIADAKYPAELKSLGYGGIDEEKQYEMAVMDVSLNFAREMKGQRLEGLDTDKLIAFRIFGIDAEFIHALRAAGLQCQGLRQISGIQDSRSHPGDGAVREKSWISAR